MLSAISDTAAAIGSDDVLTPADTGFAGAAGPVVPEVLDGCATDDGDATVDDGDDGGDVLFCAVVGVATFVDIFDAARDGVGAAFDSAEGTRSVNEFDRRTEL